MKSQESFEPLFWISAVLLSATIVLFSIIIVGVSSSVQYWLSLLNIVSKQGNISSANLLFFMSYLKSEVKSDWSTPLLAVIITLIFFLISTLVILSVFRSI